jgi:hypothetical protein
MRVASPAGTAAEVWGTPSTPAPGMRASRKWWPTSPGLGRAGSSLLPVRSFRFNIGAATPAGSRQRCGAPRDGQRPGSLVASVSRFVEFCTSEPARYQLLFQRTIPGFEPSPEAFAPAVRALNASRRSLAANGVEEPRHLDLWTAITTGLVDQQIANDPGGTCYKWPQRHHAGGTLYVELNEADRHEAGHGRHNQGGCQALQWTVFVMPGNRHTLHARRPEVLRSFTRAGGCVARYRRAVCTDRSAVRVGDDAS